MGWRCRVGYRMWGVGLAMACSIKYYPSGAKAPNQSAETPNPKPQTTRNPEPQTLNPKPHKPQNPFFFPKSLNPEPEILTHSTDLFEASRPLPPSSPPGEGLGLPSCAARAMQRQPALDVWLGGAFYNKYNLITSGFGLSRSSGFGD